MAVDKDRIYEFKEFKDRIYELEEEEITDYVTIIDAFSDAKDAAEWAQVQIWLLDRAKELNCGRAVQTLITGIKAKVKADGGAAEKKDSSYIYDGDGDAMVFDCGSWAVSDTGITQLTMIGEVRASYNPILPIRRLVNAETGEEKIEIAIYRDAHWKTIILDRAMIASAKDIYKPLASIGAGVTSESAKHLVRFLAEVEAKNNLPRERSSSKLGWHADKFIPFDQGLKFDASMDFREMFNAINQHGDREKWLSIIREVRSAGRYEPNVCMAASFASVMVGKLNMLPSVINLWGDTAGGKTVMLMMACSIWADPAESRYITDAHCTLNAIEARLDALNDLPLLMDDLSKASNKMGDKDFATLIYLLCSGRGKSRSNVKITLNKVKTWNSLTLSNMERPLATDSMQGGALNRVLDIEMGEGKVFDQVTGNKVATTLKQNYGFAGAEFIDLINNIGWDKIKEIKADFRDQIIEEARKQGAIKEDKQIDPLALLLTTDKLATEHIFKDDRYLDLSRMTSMLRNVNEINEGMRCYEYIKSFYDEHYSAFHPNEMYAGPIFGFVEDGFLYINPNVMDEICEKGNFSKKAFCRWAAVKGILFRQNPKRDTITKRINGYVHRYYAIKLNGEQDEPEAAQKAGFEDIDDMSELPFE